MVGDKERLLGELPHATMMALLFTMQIALGYFVGYIHATEMPERAEPGFMLGFVVASAFAVPAIYLLKNGAPWNMEADGDV